MAGALASCDAPPQRCSRSAPPRGPTTTSARSSPATTTTRSAGRSVVAGRGPQPSPSASAAGPGTALSASCSRGAIRPRERLVVHALACGRRRAAPESVGGPRVESQRALVEPAGAGDVVAPERLVALGDQGGRIGAGRFRADRGHLAPEIDDRVSSRPGRTTRSDHRRGRKDDAVAGDRPAPPAASGTSSPRMRGSSWRSATREDAENPLAEGLVRGHPRRHKSVRAYS